MKPSSGVFTAFWLRELLIVCALVSQSCLTLCDPVDCSLPGSTVHGVFQARILESVATSFSRESSQPSNRTQVSCIAGRFFILWASGEVWWLDTYKESLHVYLMHKKSHLNFSAWWWEANITRDQGENIFHFHNQLLGILWHYGIISAIFYWLK